MKREVTGMLVGILLMHLHAPARAEPPIQISPITRELLKGGLIVGGAIGKTLEAINPGCSQELENCWQSNSLNKNNLDRIYDLCWQQSKYCSRACKEEYFRRRKTGIPVDKADPIFDGPDLCEP